MSEELCFEGGDTGLDGFEFGLDDETKCTPETSTRLLVHLVDDEARLVCVEGIVTKCSLVQPKVVSSVHWCEATEKYQTRDYRDATAIDLGREIEYLNGQSTVHAVTSSVFPTQDDQGNPLETEFGLSTYKNHQTVVIQEMPERAPLGQLPRSVDLVLDYDLVDKV